MQKAIDSMTERHKFKLVDYSVPRHTLVGKYCRISVALEMFDKSGESVSMDRQ